MSDDGLQPEGPRDIVHTKQGGIVVIPRVVGGNYVPLKNRIYRPEGYVPPRPKQASIKPTQPAIPLAHKLEVSEPIPVINEPEAKVRPKFAPPILRKTPTKQKVKAIEPEIVPEVAQEVEVVEPALGTTKGVMILRPSYKLTDELVSYVTMALYDKSTMGFETRRGDAVIFHSRNKLADSFMRSSYEWSLWWDDDMIPATGNPTWSKRNIPGIPKSFPDAYLAINPINRLLQHGKTIIGGLYFGRHGGHGAICQRTQDDAARFRNVPENAILARKWVGTGFLLVHRSVYEDIQAKFPDLAPKKDSPNSWERVWDYFRPSEQQAEDVSFCQRALECGHQPYVDLANIVTHLGSYAYGPWDQK